VKPVQRVSIPYSAAYCIAFDAYDWHLCTDEQIAYQLFLMMGAKRDTFEILSAEDGMESMTVLWRENDQPQEWPWQTQLRKK